MHEYFLKREKQLSSTSDRFEMLRELVTMESQLKAATDLTNGMRVAVCEALEGRRSPSAAGEGLFTIEVHAPDDAE